MIVAVMIELVLDSRMVTKMRQKDSLKITCHIGLLILLLYVMEGLITQVVTSISLLPCKLPCKIFIIFYYVALSSLTVLVGHQEEHPACKKFE